jgi:hypothetical protein
MKIMTTTNKNYLGSIEEVMYEESAAFAARSAADRAALDELLDVIGDIRLL